MKIQRKKEQQNRQTDRQKETEIHVLTEKDRQTDRGREKEI